MWTWAAAILVALWFVGLGASVCWAQLRHPRVVERGCAVVIVGFLFAALVVIVHGMMGAAGLWG